MSIPSAIAPAIRRWKSVLANSRSSAGFDINAISTSTAGTLESVSTANRASLSPSPSVVSLRIRNAGIASATAVIISSASMSERSWPGEVNTSKPCACRLTAALQWILTKAVARRVFAWSARAAKATSISLSRVKCTLTVGDVSLSRISRDTISAISFSLVPFGPTAPGCRPPLMAWVNADFVRCSRHNHITSVQFIPFRAWLQGQIAPSLISPPAPPPIAFQPGQNP